MYEDPLSDNYNASWHQTKQLTPYVIQCVDIGTSIYQQLCNLSVAKHTSKHECCPPIL